MAAVGIAAAASPKPTAATVRRRNAQDVLLRQRLLLAKRIGAVVPQFVDATLGRACFTEYRQLVTAAPQRTLEILRQYVVVYQKCSRLPGQRGRGSAYQQQRDASGRLLSLPQLDALFHAYFLAVEQRTLSTTEAAVLFRYRWPVEIMKYKRHARMLVVSRATEAILNTQQAVAKAKPKGKQMQQQQQTGQEAAAGDAAGRASAVSADAAAAAQQLPHEGSAPPAPAAVTGSRTALLSPQAACSLLISLAGTVTNDPALIGSLATIALAPAVDGVAAAAPINAQGVVRLMWAVHESSTPAPAAFWHTVVQRLRTMQTQQELPAVVVASKAPQQQQQNRAAVTKDEGDDEADLSLEESAKRAADADEGEFISPLAQTQQPPAATAATKAPLAKGVSKLKALLLAQRRSTPVTPRLIFRALRVLHLQAIRTDTAFQRLLAENALAAIGATVALRHRSDASPFAKTPLHGAPTQLPRDVLTRRIVECTAGMTPKEFLSLLTLAGRLGIPYAAFGHRFAPELLHPLVRHCTRPDEQALLLEALAATKCQDAVMIQVFVDAVVRSVDGVPPTRKASAARGTPAQQADPVAPRLQSPTQLRQVLLLSRRLVAVVGRHPGLATQLDLSRFAAMLFRLLTREDGASAFLLRPAEMLHFVEELHVLARQYGDDAVFVANLRDVVESIAAVYAKHLKVGVLPLLLANKLLEFSVILRMRPATTPSATLKKKQQPTAAAPQTPPRKAYPHVMQLLALRNDAHVFLESRWSGQGQDLLEGVTGSLQVVRVFQEMVVAIQLLTFEGPSAEGLDLSRLTRVIRTAGIVPTLAASVLIRDLFFSGSTRTAGVQLPPLFQQTVSLSVAQFLRDSNLLALAKNTPMAPRQQPDAAPADQQPPSAAAALDGAALRQRLFNTLGMYPQHAFERDTWANKKAAIRQMPHEERGARAMLALWQLLRQSPLIPVKKTKELWQFVYIVAQGLQAGAADVAKAKTLVGLATKDPFYATATTAPAVTDGATAPSAGAAPAEGSTTEQK